MMHKIFGPNNHSKYEIGWKNIAPRNKVGLENIVLRHYPFNNVSSIFEVGERTPGSNNFRMRAYLKSGGSKEVLLRKFIRLRDEKSISLIGNVLNFLKKNNVPVPFVIPTKQGNKFFDSDGSFYQLYEFIEGSHYRGTAEELKNIAKEIVNLHKAFKKIPFERQIAEKFLGVPQWKTKDFSLLFEIAKTRRKKIDKEINKQKEFILNEAMLVKNSLYRASCKMQVIHGDLHPHNTIYSKGALKAFLDFERLNTSELIREVGNACHRFVRQYVVYQKKDWKYTLPKGLEIFLQEYTKTNKSMQGEIKLIPIFIRDEILRRLFNDIRLYYLNGFVKNLENGEFNKKITLLKEVFEIEKNIEKMSA